MNRSAAYRGKADNIDVILYEVLGPLLLSRMEELHHLSGLGNNGRQIRTLVEIAVIASQCQIAVVIATPVLSGDDVFGVKTQERQVILMQTAVFATVAGTLTNKFPGSLVH